MNAYIETKNGTVEVNSELLTGYLSEAAAHYSAIDSAKVDLKLIGEALEEKTGIKAGTIMKYAKSRHDDKTKEATELGELFEQLDAAMGGA
jgi:hypothetical protein